MAIVSVMLVETGSLRKFIKTKRNRPAGLCSHWEEGSLNIQGGQKGLDLFSLRDSGPFPGRTLLD